MGPTHATGSLGILAEATVKERSLLGPKSPSRILS